MTPLEVMLTESALDSYLAVPDAMVDRVDRALDVLRTAPDLGTDYDPIYPAARPSFPVKAVYMKPYGIYYTIDHEAYVVYVRFIEDERMDPRTRFTGRLR